MLMNVIALRGYSGTVREYTPELVSERKIPCHTVDSNPRQYCAWLFS